MTDKDAIDRVRDLCKVEDFQIPLDPAWIIARIRELDPKYISTILRGKDGGRRLHRILAEIFPEALLLMNDTTAAIKIRDGYYNYLGRMDTVPRDLRPAVRFENETQLSSADPGIAQKALEASDRIMDITEAFIFPVVDETVVITLDASMQTVAMKKLTDLADRLADLSEYDDEPVNIPAIQLNTGFTYPFRVTRVVGPHATASGSVEVSGYMGITWAATMPALRIHLEDIPAQSASRIEGCWRPVITETGMKSQFTFPSRYYDIQDNGIVITMDLEGGHKTSETAPTPPPAKK